MKNTLVILAIAALAFSAAAAQEGTVKAGGAFSAGEDQSSKLQQYGVVPDNDPLFGLDLTFGLGAGHFLKVFGDRLFVGDEDGRVEVGRQGGWKAGVFYHRHQNWFSNTGRSLFRGGRDGRFSIDDDIQSAVQAAGGAGSLASYAGAARPVDLRFRRKAVGLEGMIPLFDGALVVDAGYKVEKRSGAKPLALALFRGSVPNGPDQRMFEFPSTIDDKTTEARLGAEYQKDELYLAARWLVSKYENDLERYILDNPTRISDSATAGAARVQGSVLPDNKALTIDLQGAYNLPRHHRISVAYSRSAMRQDDPLLPYSLNTALAVPELPAPAIDGKIDATTFMARFTGHPGKLGYSLSYRRMKFDNQTPVYDFESTVRMDTVLEGPFENVAADWKKSTLKGEVHFDPARWVRLGLGWKKDAWERPERRVKENTVTALTFTADLTAASWISGRLTYTDSEQEVDAFGPPADGEQELARQFDVARRDTRRYEAHLTLTPLESLDFGISFARGENDFPETVFGTTADSFRDFGLDASYAIGERWHFFGSYLKEKFEWDQASNYSTGTPAAADFWRTETRDENKTWQLGFTVAATRKLALEVDFTQTTGISRQACIFAAGGSASGNCTFPTSSTNPAFPVTVYDGWPDVRSKLNWFKAGGRLDVGRGFLAGLEFWKYKYTAQDWALDEMGVFMGGFDPVTAGVRFSTFLGARIPDYDAEIYRAYLSYTF